MRRYPKTADPLIAKLAFQRLVCEILFDVTSARMLSDYRIQRPALTALQEATEAFLTAFFESKCNNKPRHYLFILMAELIWKDSKLAAIHAKRVTVQHKDVLFVKGFMQRMGVLGG